jgi:hypothetical protein
VFVLGVCQPHKYWYQAPMNQRSRRRQPRSSTQPSALIESNIL